MAVQAAAGGVNNIRRNSSTLLISAMLIAGIVICAKLDQPCMAVLLFLVLCDVKVVLG